jgi:WD40 repeat protein
VLRSLSSSNGALKDSRGLGTTREAQALRKFAFAAISVALVQAPSAAQIAIQSMPDASPRCEVAPEAQFQARRVADVGGVSARPLFFEAASRIAIVANDRTTTLFDAASGDRVSELYPANGSDPSLLGISPDGQIAAWNDGKGAIDMRRAGTGELIAQPAALQRGAVLFSPDGSRLIAYSDGAVAVLDGKTGSPIGPPIETGFPAGEPRFSDGGAKLIVRSVSRGDVAISLRTGAAAYAIAPGEGELVRFDDQGARALLTGSAGWRLLDPEKGVELAKGAGEEARFSAGGAYVLAENAAGVRIIDARSGRIAMRPGKLASTPSRRASEVGLHISPDGRTAVTRSPDGTARLWDLVRGRGLAELGLFSIVKDNAGEDPRRSYDFQFTPDGNRLITRDLEGRLTIWDTRTGVRVATVGQFTRQDYLWVADDGAFAVAILAGGAATLWNTRSGWRMADMGRFSPDPAETQFLLSPDRRLLLVLDREKLELWDVERGVNLGRRSGPTRLSDAVFSANGAWLVLRPNAEESVFEIWNARTGGRAGEARPADSATFYAIAGEDVLLTRSTASFALWDMKRGERAIVCQFSDPGLSMMEIFAGNDALVMIVDVGGGRSELWRLERK